MYYNNSQPFGHYSRHISAITLYPPIKLCRSEVFLSLFQHSLRTFGMCSSRNVQLGAGPLQSRKRNEKWEKWESRRPEAISRLRKGTEQLYTHKRGQRVSLIREKKRRRMEGSESSRAKMRKHTQRLSPKQYPARKEPHRGSLLITRGATSVVMVPCESSPFLIS